MKVGRVREKDRAAEPNIKSFQVKSLLPVE